MGDRYIFLDKDAAKQERLRAEANAEYKKASADEARAKADVTMLKMNQQSDKVAELKELASAGTLEAYIQLYDAYISEVEKDANTLSGKHKFSISGDIKGLLKSFPYTKVPGEFEKIFHYLEFKLEEGSGYYWQAAKEQFNNLVAVGKIYSYNEEVAKVFAQMKKSPNTSFISKYKNFIIPLIIIILLIIILANLS